MNNIAISEARLVYDLSMMRNIFADCPSRDNIKNDYSEFVSLNNMCAKLFYCKYDLNNLFKDPKGAQRIIDKHQLAVFNQFVRFADKNQELLLKTFLSYKKMLDDIDYQSIPFYKCCKSYSEKDFKDIIFSYFNSYGEKYYKIVKKYFDEQRIQMKMKLSDKELQENFAGFFSSFVTLSSGYILSRYSCLNSCSLASLAHELGHAIDAETFIFPQQKTLPTLSDMLLEIPSTMFEVGLIDYLIKNEIDVDGGLVLYNDKSMFIDDTYDTLAKVYSLGDVDMDFYGTTFIDGEQYDFREDMLYGLGYYFAFCFDVLKEQMENKEFLKHFNDVMTMRKESTLEEIIELSGVSYDDFVNSTLIRPKLEDRYVRTRKRFNV